MKKKKKRNYLGMFGTFTLAGAVLLSSLGVHAENGGELIDSVDHTDSQFEELTYFEVTEEDFDAVVENLATIAADINNADQVDEIIDQMEDIARKVMTNDVIANIYATLDAENQEYNDLVTTYEDLAVVLNDKLMQNYRLIAESACSEVLHARIDDEDEWEDILTYEAMTEEQRELTNRETELSLKYDELYIADYTVNIDGTEYDEEMLPEAYEAGTITIEQYFSGIADISNQRNQVLGELFLELVDVRTQLAQSYGYDNYADYRYEEVYDRDYSPEELEEYRQQVIDYMVPVEHELYELLMEDPNGTYQDMWDAEMSEQECLDNLEKYLPEISEDMMISFNYMVDHGMCDLSINDQKAPGGYTTQIYVYNAPFMFNCADGTISDMGTLIHEFGHYNEMYFASEDEWLYTYNNLDSAEIHSQGLELLFLDYGEDIYGDNAYAVSLYTLMNMAYSCVEGVKEDAFQYAIYSDPENLTIEKLNQMYYDCCVEYGSEEFYNSYYLGMYGFMEPDSITEWVEIPHTFQSPLYYVSYSVSMAAVEELWDVILDDREQGIDIYLDLVNCGLVTSFSDALEECGLNNPIENPRFDVYAANMRYYLGLQDTRDVAADAGSSDVVQEPEEEEEEPETEEIREEREEDQEDEERDSHRKDSDKESLNLVLVAVIVVGILLLLAIVIIIIALVVSGKKAKKQALNSQGPGTQMPTVSNIPPVQNMPQMQGMPPVQNMSQMPGMPQMPDIPPVPPIPDVPPVPLEQAVSPIPDEQSVTPEQPASMPEENKNTEQ